MPSRGRLVALNKRCNPQASVASRALGVLWGITSEKSEVCGLPPRANGYTENPFTDIGAVGCSEVVDIP